MNKKLVIQLIEEMLKETYFKVEKGVFRELLIEYAGFDLKLFIHLELNYESTKSFILHVDGIIIDVPLELLSKFWDKCQKIEKNNLANKLNTHFESVE